MREFIVRVSDPVAIQWHFEEPETPELVRCNDCRYSLPSSENFILCTAPYGSQYPKAYKPIDWFCKGGERKDGDENGN